MNKKEQKKLVIIGYGNPNRQDDRVGHTIADDIQNWIEMRELDNVTVITNYQIDIDMVEDIADATAVIFIDAHLPEFNVDVSYKVVDPSVDAGFTTHAFNAGDLVALCKSIYKTTPTAHILSVPGYCFDMSDRLSPKTALLIPKAIDLLKSKVNDFFEEA